MRVLLLSTYELGHQPLGLAAPAGALSAAGHDLRAADLAIEEIAEGDLNWAEAVAIAVPMHTALRLALVVLGPIRAARPEMPIALHGLYAPVAAGQPAIGPRDLLLAGELEEGLVEWLGDLGAASAGAARANDDGENDNGGDANGGDDNGGDDNRGDGTGASRPPAASRVRVELGRAGAPLRARPLRRGLAPLTSYARLLSEEGERLVGYTEASKGCSHLCRHCPVPTVYHGRTRAIDLDDVVADLERLVALGAGHITFGDPDFLNRPRHSLAVVRALHERWPGLSFDLTVKIEHVLRHEAIWEEVAESGCAFVVSAVESVDEATLLHLDKGHTTADTVTAIGILRRYGIEPRPSLLPFTPWTTLDGFVELIDFVAAHDLVENVDSVQYGIRLLIPPGSLLLDRPDPLLAASLTGYDPAALSWAWRSADPAVDDLQRAVAAVAERAAVCASSLVETYREVRRAAYAAAGRSGPEAGEESLGSVSGRVRPHLSEPWFCCAEPTLAQLTSVGLP